MGQWAIWLLKTSHGLVTQPRCVHIEAKLEAMGITLPTPPPSQGSYVLCVPSGNQIFTSALCQPVFPSSGAVQGALSLHRAGGHLPLPPGETMENLMKGKVGQTCLLPVRLYPDSQHSQRTSLWLTRRLLPFHALAARRSAMTSRSKRHSLPPGTLVLFLPIPMTVAS